MALARIAAVEAVLTIEHTVSHQSAALLWGLPMIDSGERVHVIQGMTSHRRGAPDLVRHEHVLSETDVVDMHGLRITSLERTLVDCAMSLPPSSGLVLADAALRRGADRELCAALIRPMAGRHGVSRVRAVLEHADDGAESAGESRARHLVLRAGFPAPRTQVPIPTARGIYWGDFGWPQWRLAVGFDEATGHEAVDDATMGVIAERQRRRDAATRAGWRVLRVTAATLRRPDLLVDRILRRAPADARRSLQPRIALSDAR
jgi:hypothetical protein